MDQQKEIYRQEAYELLSELESSLLTLEQTPEDADLIGRVFRALHTIKGSGAMFGFDDIAEFTHEVETVFDLIREGQMMATSELINLALASRDQIMDMLDADYENTEGNREKAIQIIESIKQLIPTPAVSDDTPPPANGMEPPDEPETLPAQNVTYRIRFNPGQDIFKAGTNPLLLLDELCELGEASVVAHMDELPLLAAMDPESCYIYWDIILTTRQDENAIKDVFIFVEDSCEVSVQVIDILDDTDDSSLEMDYKKLGEILIDRGDVAAEDLNKTLDKQKRVGERLVEDKIIKPGKVDSAVMEQQHVRKIREKQKKAIAASSIRVGSEKLDALVDLVGELVTVQARLTQKAASQSDADLLLIAEEVERLTGELRDNTMSVRMLPIGATFASFKRLVRDLTNELGKEVTLTTEGNETELDKTVIDQLKDPLVHIIRNSIDHGVEMPDERESAGKPRGGTVHLSAAHSGANVLITITDDGAGLNPDAIFNKAVEKGIIDPDIKLSESEIFNLIFEGGFSTAQTVTGVSGRGVGMDVVKRSIESLRGAIEIKSELGKGTRITLKLPLTLAIIDGLMVKIGNGSFVLPLSAVEECVEFTPEEVITARERKIMSIRGEIVPYMRLRELFGIDEREDGDRSDRKNEIEQVVVAEAGGDRVAIGVDCVIGQHQTVIKSLGKIYQDVKGTSGATILGDGTVALILDLIELAHLAEKENLQIQG